MNFLKPATTDNYSTEFVPNVQANQTDLARWLDSTYVAITGTPPVRAKRYNRASFSMEEYDAGWAAISFNATHLGGVAAVGYQADLGFAPVQQGGGTGQGTNKVYVGWATSGGTLKLQVDSSDFASIWPISITGNAATAVAATNATNATNAVYSTNAAYATGGYFNVASTTPKIEWHNTGVAASQARMLADGSIVWEQTNGSGAVGGVGEFVRLGRAYIQHIHASLANVQWHVPGYGARSITLGTDNVLRVRNTIGDGVPTGPSLLSLTSAGALDVLSSISIAGAPLSSGLGSGQTWQQFAAGNRDLDTTYTNSSGRAIAVKVGLLLGAGAVATLAKTGGTFGSVSSDGASVSGQYSVLDHIVPNGDTYRVNATSGSVTINYWSELRA